MAISNLWKQFGDVIVAEPDLTLASFLGHAPSIAAANQSGIRYPQEADFQSDPHFDPNPHKLNLDKGYLRNAFLLHSIAVWGAEALKRTANACSLLQCMHHATCSSSLRPIRNAAAFALQCYIDDPTEANREKANEILIQCREIYRPFEDEPDSAEAELAWFHLGAPWSGLETALGNLNTRRDCGESDPAPANSTWCKRNAVWPSRAIDAAAKWSSHLIVGDSVKSTLIAWAIRNTNSYS